MKIKHIIFTLIILIYLCFSIPKLNTDFAVEEEQFVMAAERINSGLGPTMHDGQEYKVFMSHPPLYIYTLALFIQIFQSSELGGKALSLVCSLLTGIILYLLVKKFKYPDSYALLAMFLFFLSPFVIQSGVHVDINGSLLLLFVTLFLYSYTLYSYTHTTRYIFCPLILSLILWSKLEGFFLIMVSLFLYHILRKRYLRAFLESAYLSFISITLFLLSWCIVSVQINANFARPFLYIFETFMSSSEAVFNLFLFLWAAKNIIMWISVPLVIGAFVYSIIALKNKENDYLLFIIFTWITFFAFIIFPITQYGFPKYSITVMPFFILLFTSYLKKANIFHMLRKYVYEIIIIAIIFSGVIVWFGDPFIMHNIFYTKSITLERNFDVYLFSNIITTLFLLLPALPFLVLSLSRRYFRKIPIGSVLVLSLFISLVVNSVYLDILQVKANYSTTQGYGRWGIKDAGEYIASITKEGDMVLTDRDVGYYSGRDFYRSYPIASKEKTEIIDTISQNPTFYKAVGISPSTDMGIRRSIEDVYMYDCQIGSIEIYQGFNE